MEFNNTTLLYGLLNQAVFSEAKMNMKYLKMYYKDNYIYQNNTLVSSLLDLIEESNFKDITEAKLNYILQKDDRSVDEANKILGKIREYQAYTKEQAKVFTDNLRDLCSSAYIHRIHKQYENNPVEYVKKLKEYDYKSNFSDTLIAKSFGELDVTDLVERYSSNGLKSRYKFINDAYTCGGYIPGQVVIVAAAPSVGKSLFLQSEAVNFIQQGKRVHYLTLGDLNELDMAIRMMCQISHKSQREVESDIIGNFELYKDKFGDYLTLTVVPSGVVTARDYVDWMKQRADEYDVLMIDYDSNFLQDENFSMYERGGTVYDALSELSRMGKLVFVASQPKQSFFGEEFLPYEAVGESSRKVHIADMIITIGRRWEAGMRMGMMNIAKNRRGTNGSCYWIGTNEGLFYECSEVLYSKYRSNAHQKSLFSYDELSTMDIIDSSISEVMSDSLIEKVDEEVKV